MSIIWLKVFLELGLVDVSWAALSKGQMLPGMDMGEWVGLIEWRVEKWKPLEQG